MKPRVVSILEKVYRDALAEGEKLAEEARSVEMMARGLRFRIRKRVEWCSCLCQRLEESEGIDRRICMIHCVTGVIEPMLAGGWEPGDLEEVAEMYTPTLNLKMACKFDADAGFPEFLTYSSLGVKGRIDEKIGLMKLCIEDGVCPGKRGAAASTPSPEERVVEEVEGEEQYTL